LPAAWFVLISGTMSEVDVTRAKILGVLIQDARLHAGRSIADCARVLNMAEDTLLAAERGEHVLSLPDLEVLALYLRVPISHFWGSQVFGDTQQFDYSELLAMRQRIVGALLRQARLQASRSIQDLAAEIKVVPEQMQKYEMGQEPIPLTYLERLSRYLAVSVDYFLDNQRGPLAQHELEQKIQRRLDSLPPELRTFVAEPINVSYLETAKRLSEMDVNKLRNIAEGLLDITY
jgi:transcriptional regulator with XRE-family HTH domain